MANNIEIKARVHNPRELEAAVADLADGPGRVIEQHDTFYAASYGRLKLRRFTHGSGELIAYQRVDRDAPTSSDYDIAPTDDPAALDTVLRRALGARGDVRKRRMLYMIGRTRVHLDAVDTLGDFMELEVVLADGEDPAAGLLEAQRLMQSLSIADEDLIDCAYVDLIERNSRT